MTYSHNRAAVGRNSERYVHGTSPPNHNCGGGSGSGSFFSNRKNNQNRGAWQRTSVNNVTNASRCVVGGNLIPTSMARTGGRYSNKTNFINNHNNFNHQNRTNGVQVLTGAGSGLYGRGSPPTLPTLTHFAGSKCFDAPAPTALPKPPQHWTSSSSRRTQFSTVASQTSSAVSKNELIDDFDTHNLKLLLNVQS